MLKAIYILSFLFWIPACGSYESSVQRPAEKVAASPATSKDATAKTGTPSASKTPTIDPMSLPSQKKQFYQMTGERPAEVCMEKGFAWIYQGFLKPQCSACHNVGNKFGVTAFAQPSEEAASFTVLKTNVNKEKFLAMILSNAFCQSCTIKEADPLYTDLKYFATHLTTCDKP